MKRNLIITLVDGIERIKAAFKVSYGSIFSLLPLCQTTYRRWRSRILNGQIPLNKPGPKPLKPLSLKKLDTGLSKLVHCRKRSLGVGELRAALKDTISRRELDVLVSLSRKDQLQRKRAKQFRLTWHLPGSVWSMDVFQSRILSTSQKGYVLSVQDLASGYKLPPLVTEKEPHGRQVTSHLSYLFHQFGSPLFLKRDNGGNLNQLSVNQLLSVDYVLPLNNPFHYAKYNGAIEHTQGEFKQQLRLRYRDIRSFRDFTHCVAIAAHDLNHISRRNLSGETSCKRFFQKPVFNYSKRKREEVYLWIYELALDIVGKADKNISLASAWRIACRLWLVKNGLLSISKYGNVLPHFSGNFAHN